jgi:hypothetical protein
VTAQGCHIRAGIDCAFGMPHRQDAQMENGFMRATVLQEMEILENIIERGRAALSVRTVCSVDSDGKCLPVYGIGAPEMECDAA